MSNRRWPFRIDSGGWSYDRDTETDAVRKVFKCVGKYFVFVYETDAGDWLLRVSSSNLKPLSQATYTTARGVERAIRRMV